MSVKLGIVTQKDFAQAINLRTSKPLGIIFWIISEIIGAAFTLYLLFGIPLIITVLDVFLFLLLMRIGVRKIEALFVCLILVILLVLGY